MQHNLACILLSLCTWLGAVTTAFAADDAPGLHWNPRWTRFTTAQYALTGTMAGGLFATNQWLQASDEPRWQSEILFDAHARSLLAADSERGRRRASEVSDYLAFGLMAYPFAIDTFLVAGALHDSYDVAWQMAMISAQSLLMAKLVTGLTKNLVSRARPDARACEQGDELACGSSNESFISGHTTGAFVGAGLICAHHQNLALYGSGTAGAIACGLSLGAASTAGALRVVAGRHHLSDVLAGAAVGLAAGYLLPNLLNYDFGADGESAATLVPVASPKMLGLQYVSSF